ncbi:MAG: hypothetical protein K6F98_07550 [Bacteroidales bacterium]|nr:hypothetical protein [Bacteroidales bacterium]
MNKKRERTGLKDLLKHLKDWSIVREGESPDFVIEHVITKEHVGIEITDYYPHRTPDGKASIKIKGKNQEDTLKNRYQFFEKTELGYSRFDPRLDLDDLIKSRIEKKDKKLKAYKKNAPDCKEFWILIMLNFYDSVQYKDILPIRTLFDKIFFWEEPDDISEIPTIKIT